MRYTLTIASVRVTGGESFRLLPLILWRKSGQPRPYPQGNPQMLPADQWPHLLANVRGTMVRGTERISSSAVFDLLQVDPDPGIRQRVAKRLAPAMRRVGWHGPHAMRIPGQNEHSAGCKGYWRLPLRPPQSPVNVDGEVDGEVDASLSNDLPDALEEVTRLGLRMLARVLRTPLDITDAGLTRSQVTAAIGAVNAQLRADEQRLRAKASDDVLERLLKEIERSRRELQAAESLPRPGQDEDMSEPKKSSDEAP